MPEIIECTEEKIVPTVIVGTKTDLYNNNESEENRVTEKDGKNLSKLTGKTRSFRCSAKEYGETQGRTGNVHEVFKEAVRIFWLNKNKTPTKKALLSRDTKLICTFL